MDTASSGAEMNMTHVDWQEIPKRRDPADFNNLLSVLRCEVPARPTLFEFILNDKLFSRAAPGPEPADLMSGLRRNIAAFYRLGFDHATVQVPGFGFKDTIVRRSAATISLNEGAVIHNRQDFEAFAWPDPETAGYEVLDQIQPDLPRGMKLIPFSPDGVLENVINLVGFEALCFMLVDDPALVEDIFEQVGARLLRYFEKSIRHDCIGACMVNDDWGFKTSTFLSIAAMRRLVFPWHKQIVEACHGNGQTAAGFGYSGPLTETVLLGSLATRFPKTTLQWNAKQMKFTNLSEADQYVRRRYRAGWEVKGL